MRLPEYPLCSLYMNSPHYTSYTSTVCKQRSGSLIPFPVNKKPFQSLSSRTFKDMEKGIFVENGVDGRDDLPLQIYQL